jgi:type II secretory pathway component GspD/PulD (secretin)
MNSLVPVLNSYVNKTILLAFVLLFSYSAIAIQTKKSKIIKPTYEIDMNLSLNGGKYITSPRITVKDGVAATMAESTNNAETFIEVVATEGQIQDRKGIFMKFKVGTVDKDGNKTIISEPQILASENEPAQISIGDNTNGTEKMSLIVVAKKTTTKAQTKAIETSKQK